MRDIIYNILIKYYQRLYGYETCEYMSNKICERIISGEFITRGDIMHYVWMQTSGGGVADLSSREIQQAFPHVLQDTDSRSCKGQVS